MYNCNLFIWVNNCEFEHARSRGMAVHHKPLTFVLSNYLESLLCTSQQIIMGWSLGPVYLNTASSHKCLCKSKFLM
jgi:hypothetical protein